MDSKFLQRLTLAAVLIGGLGLLDAQTAAATRPVRRTARPAAARGFNLFAGAVNVMMNANINNIGETCVDPTNSPVVGGGYWPKGTPDQYIFNSGMMIAGLLGGTRTTFPWAGDTVGAFIFDPRGDQSHGQGLTNVFNGLNAADLAEWPTAAYVNDPTLFDPALLTRKTVSQQDTWVRYWDGNTQLTTGRQHPMGLLIDQRGLMWNFPSGNQDIVYFLYRFINITARTAAKYDNLADYGYSAADIARIVEIANQFQDASEARYNVNLPDSGWGFTQVFAAFGQDPDVGASGQNYSTAILPFAMGVAYKSNFYEPTWAYPADIFGAPFAAAPGFEGVKYLKSPTNPATSLPFGITMFTNTTNGAPFPDRVGVQALWRLLSNNLLAQDGTCNAPVGTPMCQLVSTPVDTRFIQASGPLSIAAGQSQVIVVAYVHAAPVAAYVAGASASFDLKPGIPGTMGRLATGLDTIRTIERAAGIAASVPRTVSGLDANANGLIEQSELATVPRSLLNKGLRAQAVFNSHFLVPFAPESPTFFTIPGDGQVTVAWQESASETAGDPYFVVASDVLNDNYDSNFRRYDVEGYRIWRGRTESEMEVIASFDFAGSTMTDHTGQFWNSTDYGTRCMPELGITTTCPVDFVGDPKGYRTGRPVPTHDVLLAGDVIQVPPGGRVLLASGDVLIVTADTAVTGGNSGLPPLTDNGVPFVYTDHDVRNGFRYFYAVTVFDLNSVASGPSSLESARITRQATPRAVGTTARSAVLVQGVYGGDGTLLDPSAAWPTIDAATGTFVGPIPPTNRGGLDLLAAVYEALPVGEIIARIDSISPGLASGYGTAPTMYVSFISPTETVTRSFTLPVPSYAIPGTDTVTFESSFPFVSYDSVRSRLLHLAFTRDTRMPMKFYGLLWPLNWTPMGGALARGRWPTYDATITQGDRFLRHSYWYDETATTQPPDPTIDPYGSAAHSAGQLTGVTTIYAPAAYRQASAGGAAARSVNLYTRAYSSNPMWYPADFVVTWGSGGAITVRDSTHRTNLPFKKSAQIGYGFISAANIVAAGITSGDLSDGQAGTTFDPAVVSYHSLYTINTNCGDYWGITCADLAQNAVLQPIDYTADGVSDGNGIALVINGEPFFMLMSSLPIAGTKWHLKAIGGGHMNATCTPAIPASGDVTYANRPTDCSGYTFTPVAFRPAFAPGLQFKINITQGFGTDSSLADLDLIHTVPDPYYVTNALEITASTKVLRFVNLPDRAIIRIYSVSGILVNVLTHNNPAGGGEEVWNLRNRNNQFIASGVYFYHVESPDGRTKIGRFTVVNYAQ